MKITDEQKITVLSVVLKRIINNATKPYAVIGSNIMVQNVHAPIIEQALSILLKVEES